MEQDDALFRALADPSRRLLLDRLYERDGQTLGELETALPPDGEGLHLLTGTVTSPALGEQWGEVLQRHPSARWHGYEPLGTMDDRRAYRFERARAVVAFGGDFLATLPGSIRYARDFVSGRGPSGMNRLYVVESVPTLAGVYADARRSLSPAAAAFVELLVAQRPRPAAA